MKTQSYRLFPGARAIFAILTVAVMVVATSAAAGRVQAAEGGRADCYKGDAFTCQVEAEIARLTNAHRADSGLQPLAYDGHLSYVARAWSKVQEDRGDIGHDGFPGDREERYMQEFGSMEGLSVMGENVAMYSWGTDQAALDVAAQLTEQWWESEGHRENMLGNYGGLGVGVARSTDGSVYGTQIFFDSAR